MSDRIYTSSGRIIFDCRDTRPENKHMRTTVGNVKKEPGWRNNPSCEYIGRGSQYGNPFIIGKDGDRETVIEKYKIWARDQKWFKFRSQLRGKRLMCFCSPLPCHGDWLAEQINNKS